MKKNDFKVKFWGVRGSYPIANKDFLKYGGNTSCVEVTAGNHRIILDGGTGIIPLGDKIFKEHIEVRHIRGGESTKRKYLNI